MWKLARIKEIKKGKDGEARNVIIEMSHGRFLVRPLNSLCPLEVDDVSNKSESPVFEKSMHESKQEETIARRTRSATGNCVKEAARGMPIVNSLFLLAIISILTVNAIPMENCKWISDVSFNVPHKWNCEVISEQNFTSTTVAEYTRTYVRIPAIRCNNITRTICTKAFLRLSLFVISDKTTTSATSSHFCKTLDDQKKHNG
ncbi:unnamed protein product, partial [Onchocerca ochengi]|uniref:DUF5641 domain-containing protein n=1 Tax=Onchocerca ochengi TaxID=42157 RepID=A0A182EUN8_ONCOC